MRLVVTKNIPTPYTTPVFDRIAASDGCELMVVYEADGEPNRSWANGAVGHRAVRLHARTLRLPTMAPDSHLHLPRRPLRAIRAFGPDVIIASGAVWSSPLNAMLMAARRRNGWRIVPWLGEFRPYRPFFPRGLLAPWHRQFVRGGDAWLAYSSRAAEHAIALGATRERVILAPNSPSLPAPRTRPDRRPHAHPRFLFVGQLERRKGLDVLLDAFRGLSGAELWIAGEGAMREAVSDYCDDVPAARYLGQLDYASLSEVYGQVDALVVPSRFDVWGLVVNEAMLNGLPVIASDQVAAADELVDPGTTGEIFATGDARALRVSLESVAGWSAEQHAACETSARANAARFSATRTADAMLQAARVALTSHGPHSA